jgi:hypothetical protein
MEPATVLGAPGAQAPATSCNPQRGGGGAGSPRRPRSSAVPGRRSRHVGGNHSRTERVLDDFGRLDVLANNLGNLSQERQITSDSQARR